ncbi:MAG TPA: hypothetical protein VE439_04430 [Anaerolineae bacterium]|jgi:hypothetical protein|nr:hypothetical protein [Anaerolineae bacterium]
MAFAATLKGLLEKVKTSEESHPDCWSLLKVEKLLHDVGIKGCEVTYETKVVRVKGREELTRILLYMVPSEVSHEYSLVLSRFGDTMKVTIGCWQFEAEA